MRMWRVERAQPVSSANAFTGELIVPFIPPTKSTRLTLHALQPRTLSSLQERFAALPFTSYASGASFQLYKPTDQASSFHQFTCPTDEVEWLVHVEQALQN